MEVTEKNLLVGLLGSFKSESSSIKIEFNNLSKEVMSLILCNRVATNSEYGPNTEYQIYSFLEI